MFAKPRLWKENVHGLAFGMEAHNEHGSLDPAFNFEIWTCRGKAGLLYRGEYRKVETTRQVWSRTMHVHYSTEGPGHLGLSPTYDLRHEGKRAKEEVLQHAAWIADFWQNEGAVKLLHMPDLRLYVGDEKYARQRYVLARVQDPRGNHADTIWCAPVAEVKDDDEVVAQVLESLEPPFGHHSERIGFTATCLGGGFLDLDYDNQQIVIRGQSEKYAKEPDRTHIYFLIKKVWYPDWDVEVKD